MQIQYKGKEKFEIKLKEATIFLGYNVKIDDFDLPGPGEYEKKGISVFAIPDQNNTINVVHAEDMTLCHLGRLTHELTEDEAKQIGNIDILFLPLGDDSTLALKAALKVLSNVDPRVVVPMLYTDIEEFKKSEGTVAGEFDVLKIRKADLPEEQRSIYILKSM